MDDYQKSVVLNASGMQLLDYFKNLMFLLMITLGLLLQTHDFVYLYGFGIFSVFNAYVFLNWLKIYIMRINNPMGHFEADSKLLKSIDNLYTIAYITCVCLYSGMLIYGCFV